MDFRGVHGARDAEWDAVREGRGGHDAWGGGWGGDWSAAGAHGGGGRDTSVVYHYGGENGEGEDVADGGAAG